MKMKEFKREFGALEAKIGMLRMEPGNWAYVELSRICKGLISGHDKSLRDRRNRMREKGTLYAVRNRIKCVDPDSVREMAGKGLSDKDIGDALGFSRQCIWKCRKAHEIERAEKISRQSS